jgi:glycosyltransferase involved in cell wall biosynthesis
MSQLSVPPCKIAILIPCYNEEKTIQKVIKDFKAQIPTAEIFVFDNNSNDGSYDLAVKAGATVIREKRQGKGFVVNAMLKKISADIYVMVDADDTYPAERVYDLITPLLNDEADVVVGQRLSDFTKKAFRPFHYQGNKIICNMINLVFSSHLKDPMSGYRTFTREVAMEVPVIAEGFDIETEMTLQLLYRHFIIKEVQINYRERPKGSASKLRTIRDGFLVMMKIFSIVRAYKPLTFFGGIGLISCLIGGVTGLFTINEQILGTDIILAVISLLLILSGLVSGAIGIIIHTLNFRLLELSNINSRVINWADKSLLANKNKDK